MTRPLLFLLLVLTSCGVRDGGSGALTGPPKPASLDAWLTAHASVKAAIRFERAGSNFLFPGGTLVDDGWDDWTDAERQAVRDAFDREWKWLYETRDRLNNQGTDEYATPVACPSCVAALASSPTSSPLTIVDETSAKTIYFVQVAHALALEIGGDVKWSFQARAATEFRHYLNSQSMMHRYGSSYAIGAPNFTVDTRVKYIGEGTPATPRWTYAWMHAMGLVKNTVSETVTAVLQWSRENLTQFYGAATYANMDDHWLYPSQASLVRILSGTTRRSEPAGTAPSYWTAGCHGTASALKSMLRAVNIPLEPLSVCGHAQLYFPTEARYLDHADDLYSANVKGNPIPITNLFIDQATHESWFSSSPDFLDPLNPLCANIGRRAVEFSQGRR